MTILEESYSEKLPRLLNEIIEKDLSPEMLNDKLSNLSSVQEGIITKDNQRLLDVLIMKKNHEINNTLKKLTKVITFLTVVNVIIVGITLFKDLF